MKEAATRGEACNFIEKETLSQVFSCKFCEISRNTFFTEHLWATVSVVMDEVNKKLKIKKVLKYVVFNKFLTNVIQQ